MALATAFVLGPERNRPRPKIGDTSLPSSNVRIESTNIGLVNCHTLVQKAARGPLKGLELAALSQKCDEFG
jgi:hypothetical protein